MSVTIHKTQSSDIPALKKVIDSTDLFPSEMLDDMIAPFLGGESNDQFWLTATSERGVVGVAYYTPEAMTEGTWNLLLIAVASEVRSQGIGRKLMYRVEKALSSAGQRILLVETSDGEGYARTRKFYGEIGYIEEARIREFYTAGEGKVVFWKKL